MPPHITLAIQEYRDGTFRASEVQAIRELPLRLVINGRGVVTLQCTGTHPRHLVAGYLFGCGLIEGARDIGELEVIEGPEELEARVELRQPLAWPRVLSLTSGMDRDLLARGQENTAEDRPRLAPLPPPSAPFVAPERIPVLVRELHARSSLYRQTRGCHNASLCLPGAMLLFRSDIGRHNAIDTLVGQCLLEGVPLADKLIVSTGRVTTEIVHKAVRAGIGTYVSIAVATGQAVELARRCGLTLVGNATEEKFWVYHDPGRLG